MAEQFEKEKAKITSTIWGCATGMLAICIPLSAASNSGPIIPIAVVAGAAAGTVAVWRSDKKSQNALQPDRLQRIEQRLGDLETIVGDDLELRLKIKQLESGDRKL